MTTPWILTAAGTDQPISGYELLIGHTVPSIETIAHSLAQINRYTGHAARPYSVAEHSLLVADILAAQGLDHHAQRLGLMHDAHECLCGDVASPVKAALGIAWVALEAPLATMLRDHYRLRSAHAAHRAAVKRADLIALATERRDLLRFDPAANLPWPVLDTPGAEVLPLEAVDLNNPARAAMTWRHHRDAFVARYQRLAALCSVPANATEPLAN